MLKEDKKITISNDPDSILLDKLFNVSAAYISSIYVDGQNPLSTNTIICNKLYENKWKVSIYDFHESFVDGVFMKGLSNILKLLCSPFVNILEIDIRNPIIGYKITDEDVYNYLESCDRPISQTQWECWSGRSTPVYWKLQPGFKTKIFPV